MSNLEKKSRINQAQTIINVTNTAVRLYTDYRDKYNARRTYTMTVPEDAYIFGAIMIWVHSMMEETKHVRLISHKFKQFPTHDYEQTTTFDLHGHAIVASTEKKTKATANEYGELELARKAVTFSTRSKRGMELLIEEFDRIHAEEAEKNKEIVTHFSNHQSYGWKGKALPKRSIDSVVLPEGEKEALLEDIEKFLASEDDYALIGAPWHRGYLLYGEPGNGKTSLVQALANKYNRNLYSLSLSSISDDRGLMDKFSDMDPKSFCLLEDCDVFSSTVTRTSDTGGMNSKPTLAGLLNALDGVATPHGLVTFMTTNIVKNLDPALIRPGRMDLHLELKRPVTYQIEKMFKLVYDEPLDVEHKDFESMAQYVDILKRHIGDAEGARLEIKNG